MSVATGCRGRCSVLHGVWHLGTGADVHNRTDDSGAIWDNHGNRGRVPCGIKTMLFTIAVLVAAVGALTLYNARVAGRVNPANLGWMSAQWLAEHRASHPS
jgi:hypothetical protein